jgi:N-acetyl sugar amidotransferase
MNEAVFRVCTRCVMDTTDPDISFDENGICNHCKSYDSLVAKHVYQGDNGQQRLNALAEKISSEGVGKDYDCIIGVSGGVDSTFVAYLTKKLGLRPLAVHLDNGWNSELAVKNIENVLNKMDIPLYTNVLDWEEFRDLQVSFLKASTPDSEIPTDHAIMATLYHAAEMVGTRYVILGFNARTESHLPREWSQGHWDWRYIRSIQSKFGKASLNTFPHLNIWQYHRRIYHQCWLNLLNYVDYVKKDAMKVMESELGWCYYGGKHYESIYTRFYQGYILPRKFGYDKRKSHLSSLICSGEITRDEAVEELRQETYSPEMQAEDRDYVIKKLGFDDKDFVNIMNLPHKTYADYPNYGLLFHSLPYRALMAFSRKMLSKSHHGL